MSDSDVEAYDRRLEIQSIKLEADAEAFDAVADNYMSRSSLFRYIKQLEEALLEIELPTLQDLNKLMPIYFRCAITGRVYHLDEKSKDASERWDKEISNDGAKELYKYLGE